MEDIPVYWRKEKKKYISIVIKLLDGLFVGIIYTLDVYNLLICYGL